MKKLALYILLISLAGLSGCIKVEDSLIKCSGAPDSPVLPEYSFTKNNGQTLLLSVMNFNPDCTYTVTLPTGEIVDLGAANPVEVPIAAPVAGTYTYKLTTRRGYCISQPAQFTVAITNNLPNCGLSANNLLLGSNAYTANVEAGYNGSYNYFIQWDLFVPGTQYGNGTFTLFFKQKPPKTGTSFYTFTNADPYSLANNACRAEYYYSGGGANYVSGSGALAVTYANSAYTVTFCNASFTNISSYVNVNCNASLTFTD